MKRTVTILKESRRYPRSWTNDIRTEAGKKNLKRIMVRDGMMRGRGLMMKGRGLMMKGRGFMFLLYIY